MRRYQKPLPVGEHQKDILVVSTDFMVTYEEMRKMPTYNEKCLRLRQMLQKLFETKTEGNYAQMEAKCDISQDLLRKIFRGTRSIQRDVLAKFVVGLRVDRSTVNELYDLLGHPLNDKDPLDHITICALRDGDDIYRFIEEFEKYILSCTDNVSKSYR